MTEGDIVLIHLPQTNGTSKLRPALLLKQLPKYNDYLACGISSQLHQYLRNIDEILDITDINFPKTGLRSPSVIRLLFIAVIPTNQITGTIRKISPSLHKQLLRRLSNFLIS